MAGNAVPERERALGPCRRWITAQHSSLHVADAEPGHAAVRGRDEGQADGRSACALQRGVAALDEQHEVSAGTLAQDLGGLASRAGGLVAMPQAVDSRHQHAL